MPCREKILSSNLVLTRTGWSFLRAHHLSAIAHRLKSDSPFSRNWMVLPASCRRTRNGKCLPTTRRQNCASRFRALMRAPNWRSKLFMNLVAVGLRRVKSDPVKKAGASLPRRPWFRSSRHEIPARKIHSEEAGRRAGCGRTELLPASLRLTPTSKHNCRSSVFHRVPP